MIYEIYLSESNEIVVIYNEDYNSMYGIRRYYDENNLYLVERDENLGEVLPLASNIFKLIISDYKTNKDDANNKYKLEGRYIYAFNKYGLNKYTDYDSGESEIIEKEYFDNYEQIVTKNLTKRIGALSNLGYVFRNIKDSDRIYLDWFTSKGKNELKNDYEFTPKISIKEINPNIMIGDRNVVWLKDERDGSDYVKKYRKNELEKLVDALSDKKVIALVGEHGIGKSMLARTVVSDFLDGKETYLFWLDYAGERQFKNFIYKINQKWDPNPGYNSIEKIIQALNEDTYYIEDECVIVIDNLNYSNDTFFV